MSCQQKMNNLRGMVSNSYEVKYNAKNCSRKLITQFATTCLPLKVMLNIRWKLGNATKRLETEMAGFRDPLCEYAWRHSGAECVSTELKFGLCKPEPSPWFSSSSIFHYANTGPRKIRKLGKVNVTMRVRDGQRKLSPSLLIFLMPVAD